MKNKYRACTTRRLTMFKTALVAGILSAGGLPAHTLAAVAYYSDNNSDRVFVIDPRNMALVDEIPTTGSQPYPIDGVSGNKVYVSTRNSASLDIIDYDGSHFFNAGTIPLTHKPRSVTYNPAAKLAAVSGTKNALTTIIDTTTDTVIGVVGDPAEATPTDFGGTLATGHAFWVSDSQFLTLDRARRQVHMYKVWKSLGGQWHIWRQDTIATPTAVHHFDKVPNASNWFDQRTFYGMAEGAPNDGKHPSVLRVFVLGNRLLVTGNGDLVGPDVTKQGSHHLGMHPNGVHIYAGSNEGNMYVLNRYTLGTLSVVPTGAASGHTTFNAASGVATQTNHRDTFMSLIDMTTHTLISTVDVASATTPTGNLGQSHTTSFDPANAGVYYTSAAAEGNYVEVDAVSGTVTRTLPLDIPNGYTIQGFYNWNLQ